MQSTSESNRLEAESVTTLEQASSAIQRGFPLNVLMKHSPICLDLTAQRQALVRQAAPLFKELHSSVPYYANRPLDDPFWSAYVGSRAGGSQGTGRRAPELDRVFYSRKRRSDGARDDSGPAGEGQDHEVNGADKLGSDVEF